MKFKSLLAACSLSLIVPFAAYGAEKKPAPPKPPKKVVDLDTRYTRVCKSLAAKKGPEARKLGTVSEGINNRLNKSQELMAKEDFQGALEIVKSLYERNKERPYIAALTAMNLGHIYINLNQNAQAMRYYEIALNTKALQVAREQGARLQLANFNYQDENYKKAEQFLLEWFSYETKPSDTGYTLLAGVYTQQGRLEDAICPAYLSAINSDKYSSAVFSIMLNAHNELKDMSGTIKVAAAMLEIWPEEKRYWRTLGSLYTNAEQFTKGLAVYKLMHRRGLFDKKDDYKFLQTLYALNDVPYDSAEILEEGIKKGLVESDEKNWGTIAQNWFAAQEYDKSVKAYGEAAKYTDDGKLFERQGDILADRDKWKEAIAAYDKAIAKGSLRDIGKVYYSKGYALYNMGEYDRAIETLSKAAGYKKWSKRARQYTEFVRGRKVTLAELAAN